MSFSWRSIILAMVLRLGAEPFSRWLGIPQSVALIASGLLALAVAGGVGYLFGTLISRELQDVITGQAPRNRSFKSRCMALS
jgi:predicted PurR-regulated permease PerM